MPGPFAVPVQWLAKHWSLKVEASGCGSCGYQTHVRLPDDLADSSACLYSFRRHIEGGLCRDFI